jgi:ectoine hydroxylase-related dioxygenase (phytanoyl-CoA dioxygenase family)
MMETSTTKATLPRFSARSSPWLDGAAQAVAQVGCCVVEDVLSERLIEDVSQSLYSVRDAIHAEIGVERLDRAGEIGVLRLMQYYHADFLRFLELPVVTEIIDRALAPTAIQHTQNGFILPPLPPNTEAPGLFQMTFHQDFPRVLNGYMMSLNLYFSISDFTEETGATRVIPGSHQLATRPSDAEIAARAVSAVCPPGSMLVFDSTLWHAAGFNRSGRDRLSVNHQFTRSYIKQQIDYPRALGIDAIEKLAPRTQQLLGYYTRIPASLDDYYQPREKRLYRANQG